MKQLFLIFFLLTLLPFQTLSEGISVDDLQPKKVIIKKKKKNKEQTLDPTANSTVNSTVNNTRKKDKSLRDIKSSPESVNSQSGDQLDTLLKDLGAHSPTNDDSPPQASNRNSSSYQGESTTIDKQHPFKERSGELVESVGIGNLRSMPYAEVIIINKITTKNQRVFFKIGEVKFFGNLSIEAHKCINDPNPLKPNNLMLLTIFDNKIDDDKLSIFHGWMMSNNLAISTLEHPVYDVIPHACHPTRPTPNMPSEDTPHRVLKK